MRKITSTANEQIKVYKALKTKKGREQYGCYLLEGRRAVTDALTHGVVFETLLTQEGYAFTGDVPCERIEVSAHVMEALSDTPSPEGIMAVAGIPDTTFRAENIHGLVVYLDRLQDAGNVGTIIRTCDAAGAGAVVLSEGCVELFNPKTVRATMSSLYNIPVFCAPKGIEALRALKSKGYTLCAADLAGEPFFRVSGLKKETTCLCIGNEGNGLCDEVRAVCDRTLTLPMRGGAESLNAAIAAGIMVYTISFAE